MQGISRYTDYAIRLLVHLATTGDQERVTTQGVAAARLIPSPYLRRVVADLAAARLVTTTRGARGGLRLARPPAEVSLLDVVRAMEGGATLNRCVERPCDCPFSGACPVRRAWAGATGRLEADLAGISMESLVPRPPARRRR